LGIALTKCLAFVARARGRAGSMSERSALVSTSPIWNDPGRVAPRDLVQFCPTFPARRRRSQRQPGNEHAALPRHSRMPSSDTHCRLARSDRPRELATSLRAMANSRRQTRRCAKRGHVLRSTRDDERSSPSSKETKEGLFLVHGSSELGQRVGQQLTPGLGHGVEHQNRHEGVVSFARYGLLPCRYLQFSACGVRP